jgi:hypothetical protein
MAWCWAKKNNLPQGLAQYMRVWPWHTFTFTKYGPPDASNPRWAHFAATVGEAQVYNTRPTEDYYRSMLGDHLQFGLNLKPE